jgi:hypothetical protein
LGVEGVIAEAQICEYTTTNRRPHPQGELEAGAVQMVEPIAAPATIRATSNLLIWIKRGEERGLNGKPKEKSEKKRET